MPATSLYINQSCKGMFGFWTACADDESNTSWANETLAEEKARKAKLNAPMANAERAKLMQYAF